MCALLDTIQVKYFVFGDESYEVSCVFVSRSSK